MNIEGVTWLRDIVDKLASKDQVKTDEVEQVLNNKPQFRFVKKGEQEGEDIYMALGQTDAGRYLAVLFIHKKHEGLNIECQRHGKQGEKAVWQKVNLRICLLQTRSKN